MLTSNDAVEDIQCEINVINSTIFDIPSSPLAVRSFRKAKIHSNYQSVKDGQQPVSIMQQNKCLCVATAVIMSLYRVELLRHIAAKQLSMCCHCSNHGSIHDSTIEA